MKNIGMYIINLIIVLIISSCSEQMELEPISQITSTSFFKTEADVEGAINGLYYRLRNSAMNDLYIWGEARSEMMERALAGTLDLERYYDNTLSTDLHGPGWDNLYSVINATNLILKYTPDINFSTEAKKNDALAQAYSMRAFVYFVLVKTWGDVPLRLEALESYDPATIQLPRTPKEEIFSQIKSDIDNALQLFPNNSFPAGRNKWSLSAAQALKGDVYLWTGKLLNGGSEDITTALSSLNSIKSSDVQLLSDYEDIFEFDNKGNKEIIMTIHRRRDEVPSIHNYAHYMHCGGVYAFPAYVPQWQIDRLGVKAGYNGDVWRITKLVRDQFTDDDLRKDVTYIDMMGSNPDEYFTNYGLKFDGIVASGIRYMVDDYILYRYADVLLMIAEAKNALGQDPTAEINMVRERAYKQNFINHAFVNGTKEQNDIAILRERLFELALEGKRWWDLIRFGKAFDLVPSLQGKESQTHLLVFPVGKNLLSKESLIEETSGYSY